MKLHNYTKFLQFKTLQAKAFQLRGGIWTILFAAILFLANPSKSTIILGIFFIILGQALRCWAAGCIGRYRGEHVGALTLTTWGPYAFIRNPLYAGNALIGFGWSIMAGIAAMIIFVIAFILLYTLLIVPYEESFLLEKFGAEYVQYKKRTSRFFPVTWPVNQISGPFDRKILSQSEIHSFLTTITGSLLIIAKFFI